MLGEQVMHKMPYHYFLIKVLQALCMLIRMFYMAC